MLKAVIREKNLGYMFQNDSRVDQIANQAAMKVDQLCAAWKVPREVGQDIAKLALFDIILFIGTVLDRCVLWTDTNNYQTTAVRCSSKRVAHASMISS